MGGSPTSSDIMSRMKAQAFKEYHTMSTLVILRDSKTGEEYGFRYDDSELDWGDNANVLIAKTLNRLAKEWKGCV